MSSKLRFRWPFTRLREKLKSIIADSGKGAFKKSPFTPPNTDDLYNYYDSDGYVGAAVDSWVNFAVGRGFDLEGDNKDALELCEEFSEAHNLDKLFPNIGRNVVIAGYCPVETFITSLPDKSALRIVHPKTVKDVKWNRDETEIDKIIQKVGMKTRELDYAGLAWFNYGQVGNNPFGTSPVKRVAKYLDIKDRSVEDMDAILENFASPLQIFKSRGDIKTVKQAVENRKAGEAIYLGQLDDVEMEHVVETIQMDPRARFWEYIEYNDQIIYVGLMAPSLFYFRDATEASSRVLLEIVDRNVYALARNLKRVAEEKWFKPLCQLNGIEEDYPKIQWREKPAMKDLHLPDLIGQGLQSGMLSREEYLEVLKNIGLKFEVKPETLPLPKLPFQPRQQPPLPLAHSLREGDESYIVTKLGKISDVKPSGHNSSSHSHQSSGSDKAHTKS